MVLWQRITISLIIVTSALVTANPAAAESSELSEEQKIERLYQEILNSNAIFIRNGVEYNASKAVTHLKLKKSNVGDRIKTAEQFIDYLATKSSMTGIKYYVKLPGGNKIPSGQWLHARLDEIEAGK